jgi:hypothetical protein
MFFTDAFLKIKPTLNRFQINFNLNATDLFGKLLEKMKFIDEGGHSLEGHHNQSTGSHNIDHDGSNITINHFINFLLVGGKQVDFQQGRITWVEVVPVVGQLLHSVVFDQNAFLLDQVVVKRNQIM